jgi:hypothetical protein
MLFAVDTASVSDLNQLPALKMNVVDDMPGNRARG